MLCLHIDGRPGEAQPVIDREIAMSHMDIITPSAAQRPFFAGIDIGGTSIKIGVVDDLGRTLGKSAVLTHEERGPAEALGRALSELSSLLASIGITLDDVGGAGVGSPGPQDVRKGTIIAPDNLPHWRDFPVVDFITQATGKPTAFANDANAAAFGECWVGRGREFHSIVMFTLGTGVGGGIIIGDLLVEGDHSHGGELGHIIIDLSPTARTCNSGRGHLEGYASATAVVQRAEEALARGAATSVRSRLEAGEPLTPILLWEEARKGDRWARDLILETAEYLGIGVVTLMHVVNPGAVILGGAMDFGGHDDEIGRAFLERVREVVRRRAFPIPARSTTIDFALLGGDAGFIGAAGLARFAYHKAKK
jgi:glucokinase